MLLFSNQLSAQFPQMGNDIDGEAVLNFFGSSVSLSTNGKVLAAGATLNSGNGNYAGHVRIYDWNGAAWIQKGNDIDGENSHDNSGTAISLNNEGNIIAIGASNNSDNGVYAGHVRIYEWNGITWIQKGNDIDGENSHDNSGSAVSLSADGNIIAIGARENNDNGNDAGHVRIYEWNGTIWVQKGNDIDGENSFDKSGWAVSLSADGSIIAIGAPDNSANGNYSGHARIYEWNGTIWVQKGNDIDGEAAGDNSGWDLSLSSNGNTLAIGAPYNNENGNYSGHVRVYVWSGTTWIQKGNDIDGVDPGAIAGLSVSLSSNGNKLAIGTKDQALNPAHIRIYKWNGTAWLQEGNGIQEEVSYHPEGHAISLSGNGNRLAIGSERANGNGSASGHVRIYSLKGIYGYAYQDFNKNCIQDSLEIGLAQRILILTPGNIVLQTNSSGFWLIDSLPIGTYTITADSSSSNWQLTCPVTQSFTVTNSDSLIQAPSFGYHSNSPCSAPDISIQAPFLRPGFSNQYIYIQACNSPIGSAILNSAYAIVELDPLLSINTASIPYTNLGNNQYQVNLGDLYPGQCTNFVLNTTLSTNAVLGQTLCMNAKLYPVDSCALDSIPNPYPNTPLGTVSPCTLPWDRSSLSVEVSCVNDSVRFVITNTGYFGSGDMDCFTPVRIYLDGAYILLDSIQLVGGDSTIFMFAGNGQTWRLEADQHPLHPGNSQPNATIENCGTGVWARNLVNILPHDDADPVVDIYCGLVTGSYDPNNKIGYPLGAGINYDVLPNQDMEYVINFQNTGTDTAFTIVIRDTLSTDFDIFSVQAGVSSNDYTFRMYGPRILEWKFNNIMLPDSNVNEPASHGFVTFKVNQVPNLPNGTVIENSAAIYFDFNAPIITNTSWHTINDNFFISIAVTQVQSENNTTKIFPNPTTGIITIQIDQDFNTATIQTFNTLGQLVSTNRTREARSNLTLPKEAGIYFIRVEIDGVLHTHKVVKK